VRILIVTNLYPNPRQPHRASFNRLQFAALAKEHQVRVIAPIAWTAGRPHGPRVSDGIVIEHPRYVYTPGVLRGLHGQFFEHSIRRPFAEHLRSWSPHVVLACWGYPDAWAATRLAREARLPVAVKLHGSDVLTLGRGARLARTADMLRAVDGVITVSQNLRDRAIDIGAPADRTHVVHNGIDSIVFCPGSRDSARRAVNMPGPEPLLLFVGNLLPVKGVDVLIESLGRLHRSRVPFRCVCIGAGPLKRKLIDQVEQHALSDRVHFFPPRPQGQLVEWYRAADLLVLPSRSEGIPNVLLEAMACGTPFVATRVGGVPEVSDPASLVPAEDPDALASRIQQVLGRPTQPHSPNPFSPGSWDDSARSLGAALDRIVHRASRAA
jgi:glycosyltransferase involved in cell wall biosynthesis